MMDIELLSRADNDLGWFGKNYDTLVKEYDNKFIAIKCNKIIESDKDITNLLKKLKKMGEKPSEIFIRHMSKIHRIL